MECSLMFAGLCAKPRKDRLDGVSATTLSTTEDGVHHLGITFGARSIISLAYQLEQRWQSSQMQTWQSSQT